MPKTGHPRNDRRPPVLLTVPLVNDQPLTALQRVYLNRVLVHHDHPITDRLTHACLGCGSIGEIHADNNRQDRDDLVEHFDFTCCGPDQTVLFHTQAV